MLGFEVYLKDSVIRASIGNDGVLPVIVSYVNKSVVPERNGTSLYIGASDNFEHITWFSGKIDDIEFIKIKVVDVENNSPLLNSYPEDKDKMLETYLQLKNELEAEGLL